MNFGTVSSPAIDGYVRDRLRSRRDGNALPPAQSELADDEIVALLKMSSLSPQQARRIERQFFEG